MITAEEVRELFDYDPASGLLTRRITRSSKAIAGAVAGNKDSKGYLQICINRKVYRVHRLIWLHVHGAWPDHEIDHVNGVRDDNRLCNLRDVPRALNSQNLRTALSNNKTGYLGVSLGHNGKWVAQIKLNRKIKHLGYFSTPEAAHEAYLQKKRLIHKACTI